jgi:molecular chaperone DnaK (HSP70)
VALVKPGSPFQISINYESKRKTPALIGFYKGERLFGANADGILARKPRHVFVAPHRLLGRNASHPAVV